MYALGNLHDYGIWYTLHCSNMCIQWNHSITDTLGPGYFLLQYRGLPLSEGKNVLVTPKIITLIMEVFIESLIWRIC